MIKIGKIRIFIFGDEFLKQHGYIVLKNKSITTRIHKFMKMEVELLNI